MSDSVLVKLDVAQHALAECKTVMEAKQIADVAEAARVYLERTNASVETVNRDAEIRTLAERQMGAFLKQMPKQQGARGIGKSGLTDGKPTLADIGITHKQSATAQKLADLPEPEFHERIAVAKASGDGGTMTRANEHMAVQGGPQERTPVPPPRWFAVVVVSEYPRFFSGLYPVFTEVCSPANAVRNRTREPSEIVAH